MTSIGWLIDYGATYHIIHNSSLFFFYAKTLAHTSVILPNGQKSHVTHLGFVKLSDSIILINVLCVPYFHVNLVSVSKLTKYSTCVVVFSPTLCTFHYPITQRVIGTAEQHQNLYYFQKNASHIILVASKQKQAMSILLCCGIQEWGIFPFLNSANN